MGNIDLPKKKQEKTHTQAVLSGRGEAEETRGESQGDEIKRKTIERRRKRKERKEREREKKKKATKKEEEGEESSGTSLANLFVYACAGRK